MAAAARVNNEWFVVVTHFYDYHCHVTIDTNRHTTRTSSTPRARTQWMHRESDHIALMPEWATGNVGRPAYAKHRSGRWVRKAIRVVDMVFILCRLVFSATNFYDTDMCFWLTIRSGQLRAQCALHTLTDEYHISVHVSVRPLMRWPSLCRKCEKIDAVNLACRLYKESKSIINTTRHNWKIVDSFTGAMTGTGRVVYDERANERTKCHFMRAFRNDDHLDGDLWGEKKKIKSRDASSRRNCICEGNLICST